MSPETERVFNEARDATLLGGTVRVAETTGPRRDGFRVVAEWSFELHGDWQTYARDVSEAMQAKGYQQTVGDADVLAFSKAEPGDVYSVGVRPAPGQAAAATLRVVATFAASPD